MPILLGPPSQCTNMSMVSTSETNIVIQWSRPAITGRPDFFYKVFHSDPDRLGEFIAIDERFISNDSIVTYNITNLQPSRTYVMKVQTHNNVSDQDYVNNNMRECNIIASTLRIGEQEKWKYF